ncbi:cysteine proteinase [Piedraia hortae CBS 480.64]|uniref:Cysteine proteinase n=1 Tax=Piedraia hortae CBS 480.64 TaxID=1314780 RepID=A0A6A7C0R1_9PEZI|nr:cysteine proteinase [Piedraia hortae CBS 480.64]
MRHKTSSASLSSNSGSRRMSNPGFHPFGGRVSKHYIESSNGSHGYSPDDAYLSYYDVRLTRDDVDAIRGDWLTDNAIAFWQEYLERERLKAYPNANIVLLRPSMCYMLMCTEDPRSLKSALPDFSKASHIFLPVNDSRNPAIAEAGSHWSLLLVSVIDGCAFHYDSMTPANRQEAKLVTRKLSQLLGISFRFYDLTDTPQQENGMDCGMYVCLIMSHLLFMKLLAADKEGVVNMRLGGKDVDAAAGRREMLRRIESFRREGERRRSSSRSRSLLGSTKSRSPPRVGEENSDA